LTSQFDHSIIITTIGDFEAEAFKSLGHKISRIFGFPTKEMPLLQDIDFALDKRRGQYYSTLILEELASRAPASAIKVLAITDVDLFIPILTHVYGETVFPSCAHKRHSSPACSRRPSTNWDIPSIFAIARIRPASCITAVVRTMWIGNQRNFVVIVEFSWETR
jgi:hypothetical protein